MDTMDGASIVPVPVMSLSARSSILTFLVTIARAIQQQFILVQDSEDDSSVAGPSNSTQSDKIQNSVQQGRSGFKNNNLRLFPPPLFSRQAIPQLYKFSIYIYILSFLYQNIYILRFPFV